MYGPHNTRTHWDNMKEALQGVEASGDAFLIDQTAWLLGLFKGSLNAELLAEGCPKILALLPEMQADPIAPRRMLTVASYMDREDDLGRFADQLRKHGG